MNPIPLSALALAALMLGIVGRERERAELKPLGSRAICLLAALFCAANALLWSRWYGADREFRNGSFIVNTRTLADASYMDGVNALRRACELNPWMIEYSRQRLDVIFRTAAAVSPEQGRQLIEKAAAIAERDVILHPGNASSHEMRATALELLKRFGVDRLAEASAEIKTATEEDPTALFVLRRRMEIARALHDQTDFDRTLASYQRVIGLTGENPAWTPFLK